MRPSRASSTAAPMTSAAAVSNVPRIDAQIERYPQKRLPTVKSVGRTKSPRDRRSRDEAFMAGARAASDGRSLPPGQGRPAGPDLVALPHEDLRVVGHEEVDPRSE